MGPDQLLEGLTDTQKEAVTHAEGPLLVLAGPGSGKTRVITHRAAYLACTVTQPRHILAVTFTNKAANEMAERIRQLSFRPGIRCCTFHSFCARLLRAYAARAGLRQNFSIFDQTDQIAAMKDAIRRADVATENFTPGAMLNAVSKAKNDMVTPKDFEQRASGWREKVLSRIYAAYQTVLAEQNALDFDDLLVKAARLLGDDPALRHHLQEQFRYVLVDEYQDTNHAQYLLARGLALEHENLCVTGDPDQSIYAWRGANLNNILDFEHDFPKASVVRLEQNYRSTPEILDAADALISHNTQRKEKTLWTTNTNGPQPRVIASDNQYDEAMAIASEIRRHVEAGGRYGDVAVFYRINALSRVLEAALRDSQIPYQIARGVAFYQRKEIKDVLAYLKVIANPLDQVSLLRIINTPSRGIGNTSIARILAHARSAGKAPIDLIADPGSIPNMGRSASAIKAFSELLTRIAAVASQRSVQKTIEFVVLNSGLQAMWHNSNDDDAKANVDELITAAGEYDRQQHEDSGSLVDWLQQVSLVSDVDAIDEQLGAVSLMTLHAAKGLEFHTVFIAGVEDGLLPHERSNDNPKDLEEERRLCFVGMTRAMRSLTLTYAKHRDFRGMTKRTSRSIFLAELPHDGIEWVSPGKKNGRPGLDDMRSSSVDYADWRRGQLLRHPEYGVGRLMWIRPEPKGTRASIFFEKGGEKSFILEYSEVEPVETMDWD